MRKLYNFLMYAIILALLLPANSHAQAKIVISQVYGGGGNTGATLRNDFIELFNAGNQPQDITGWSVQYASSTGATWSATSLTGTIQPGKYFLIQQAAGTGGTQNLPTPDATGTLALAGANGKVALVNNSTALTGSCPTGSQIIDFVGYGSANCFEGAGPTGALTNTTAAIRKNNGCTDTDNNNTDFDVSGAPNPRNSSTEANSCSSPPPIIPISGIGLATPSSALPGATVLLTITVTPASSPASTGINVSGNLSSIGGSNSQAFFDNGTNGDVTAGDKIFSFLATIAANTSPESKSLAFTIADAETRSANGNINLTVQAPPSAVQSKIVISQVYGGGGNSGATLTNDFIELFNAGNQPQNINGWSVQYASSTGATWSATSLTGTIQPGKYFLIQQAAGTGGTQNLPTPDATGTLALAGANGKVALVNNSTALTGSCPTGSQIIDFVGYGSANCFEGAGPTGALTNTTAAIRKNNGCTDTDNNNTDFEVSGAPNPRNSSASANLCSGILTIVTTTLPPGQLFMPYNATVATSGGKAPISFRVSSGALPSGLILSDAGVISGIPGTVIGSPFSFSIEAKDANQITATQSFSLVVNPVPACNPTQIISSIQGSGITSPLIGSNVTVSGIVTGRKSNGFFIQSETPDADPNTSEGLFIFTSSAPPAFIQSGNELCVSGTVFEFVSSLDPGGRSLTQLTTPTAFVTNINKTLPAPFTISTSTLLPNGGIDQLEKYENMRVTIPVLEVVAPTQGTTDEIMATASSNGFFYGVISGTSRPFREPGIQEPITAPLSAPPTVQRWDGNPELIGVASSAQPGNSPLNVATGDEVLNLTGPLDFLRRYFVIHADGTGSPQVVVNNTGGQSAPNADNDELTVATYNIERFFDATNDPDISEPVIDPTAFDNRLNKAALGIINHLKMPDVIGFQEIENLNTLQVLANRVNQRAVENGLPNPSYTPFLEQGNDPGGIDVGFLVKSTRVQVESVTQFGKNTTFTNPTSGAEEILNDRPPLVLKAVFNPPTGCHEPVPFIVITNHLRSLNGVEDLTDGRVRTKRLEQAKYLAHLINEFTNENSKAKIISLGDYNAFEFNDGYVDVLGTVQGTPVAASSVTLPSPEITNPVLFNLVNEANTAERYSYVFSGSAQNLDHILVNPNMFEHLTRFVPVHFNADYPQILRGNFSRPERISDHDPLIGYFKFAPVAFSCSITPVLGAGPNTNGTPNQLYIGYGPKNVTLNAQVQNGTAVSYQWSPAIGLSCTDCASPVFTPTAPGLFTFTVLVTNTSGCTSTCEVTICVTDIRVGSAGRKVLLCHRPRRNPDGRTLRASVDRIPVRLQNSNSRLGDCNNGNCETLPSVRMITSQSSEEVPAKAIINHEELTQTLAVKAMPNPSNTYFTLEIKSNDATALSIRVFDLSGKVITQQNNTLPNTTLRIGETLKPGIYFAEIAQKNKRVVVKLIKTD